MGVILVVIGLALGLVPATPRRQEPQRQPIGRCVMAYHSPELPDSAIGGRSPRPGNRPTRASALGRQATQLPRRPGRLALAGHHHRSGLLRGHHQPEEPERVLHAESDGPANLADAGQLPACSGERLRHLLHEQPDRHRGLVIPAVLISFMAAYAIVRGSGRYLKLDQQRVPPGPGHSAARNHHSHLLDDHPMHMYDSLAGPHPALHCIRHTRVGADPVQLHAGRSQRALRVHAAGRLL